MNKPVTHKFYGLDHLRTFAILVVFLFHYYILSGGQPEWLPKVASFGWTGVDLFFVLSGFLISSQLFEQIKIGESISFRTFFLKRFFRIIPAFGFTVILYFCVPFFREKDNLAPLWKYLTFTQNLGLNLKLNGAFSHAWSLCVEEHFYLFLPLVLLLLQAKSVFKYSYWLLILLFLGGFAIRYYSYTYLYLPKSTDDLSWMYWYKYLYYPTYTRLDGLLVGVSIAGFYQFSPKIWARISQYGNLLLVASLAILTFAYFLCEDQTTFNASVFGFPIIALGYGLMIAGAISPNSFLYRIKSMVTSQLASLSYGLYLTHKGVIHVTHQMLSKYISNPNLMLVISMITCILFAYLLQILIEKPFMRLRNRVL